MKSLNIYCEIENEKTEKDIRKAIDREDLKERMDNIIKDGMCVFTCVNFLHDLIVKSFPKNEAELIDMWNSFIDSFRETEATVAKDSDTAVKKTNELALEYAHKWIAYRKSVEVYETIPGADKSAKKRLGRLREIIPLTDINFNPKVKVTVNQSNREDKINYILSTLKKNGSHQLFLYNFYKIKKVTENGIEKEKKEFSSHAVILLNVDGKLYIINPAEGIISHKHKADPKELLKYLFEHYSTISAFELVAMEKDGASGNGDGLSMATSEKSLEPVEISSEEAPSCSKKNCCLLI